MKDLKGAVSAGHFRHWWALDHQTTNH